MQTPTLAPPLASRAAIPVRRVAPWALRVLALLLVVAPSVSAICPYRLSCPSTIMLTSGQPDTFTFVVETSPCDPPFPKGTWSIAPDTGDTSAFTFLPDDGMILGNGVDTVNSVTIGCNTVGASATFTFFAMSNDGMSFNSKKVTVTCVGGGGGGGGPPPPLGGGQKTTAGPTGPRTPLGGSVPAVGGVSDVVLGLEHAGAGTAGRAVLTLSGPAHAAAFLLVSGPDAGAGTPAVALALPSSGVLAMPVDLARVERDVFVRAAVAQGTGWTLSNAVRVGPGS